MRKIVQTMLLVTLLATGFYLVPPVSADTSEIGFSYVWEEETGTEIHFNFYYEVTTTTPALLFGGTEQFYIDLQPSRSELSLDLVMNGHGYWDLTFEGEAPIGEETFRIETPSLRDQYGIEAFLIGVDGTPYVSYSDNGRVSASGTLRWNDAGRKSFSVTAPFGIAEGDISAIWFYEWKVRFGLDLVGIGDLFNEWNEMDDLKSPRMQNYHIYYGFGFVVAVLVPIVAIPVALVIRRRRKLKPELEAEPEPLEMYCRSCGKPISTTSEYCNFCGTKVE